MVGAVARALKLSFLLALLACALAPAAQARDGYVAENSGNVQVINVGNNTAGKLIPTGGFPVAVAITPDGTRVYAVNNNGSVAVIDTASNTVIGSPIPAGLGAGSIAITPDGRQAYVTNRDAGPPGTVTVIDTASNTVTRTITVGNQPKGVAVTPNGQFAYVTNGGSN